MAIEIETETGTEQIDRNMTATRFDVACFLLAHHATDMLAITIDQLKWNNLKKDSESVRAYQQKNPVE